MSRFIRDAFDNTLEVFVPGGSQNVTVGASSTQSAALGGNTLVVRLVATSDCRIAVGANPTATATSMLLPSGAVEYIAVPRGSKIAAIQNTAAGVLNITEMA